MANRNNYSKIAFTYVKYIKLTSIQSVEYIKYEQGWNQYHRVENLPNINQ